MKKLLLLLPLTFLSVPVQAQQTNIYQTCTNYQENYAPGYYDSYGNYIQGNVNTQNYNVNCQNQTYYRPNGGNVQPSPVVAPIAQPANRACVTLGAATGAGIGYWSTKKVSWRWATIPAGIILGGLTGGYACN